MAKPIFNNNIVKSCDYCRHSIKSSAYPLILCKFKGPVGTENCCRKYVYDPIKRTPMQSSGLQNFNAKDFEL